MTTINPSPSPRYMQAVSNILVLLHDDEFRAAAGDDIPLAIAVQVFGEEKAADAREWVVTLEEAFALGGPR